MTPEQVRQVTTSLERVQPRLPAVAAAFYDRLFGAHPELRAMFPAELDAQVRKFAHSLQAVVTAIPDFAAFAQRSAELGRLHGAHRITAAQYDAVGTSLVATLAAEDPGFEDGTREAWVTAYDLLAESMLLAARSAPARRVSRA